MAVLDGDAQAAGEHDLVRDAVEVVAGQSSADADDGDGQPAGPQLPEQARRRTLTQAHLKPWMLAPQQRHRTGCQHGHGSREHAELYPACEPVTEGGQVLLQGINAGQYPPCVLDHDGPRGTHAHASRLADKERVPGRRLHRRDLP